MGTSPLPNELHPTPQVGVRVRNAIFRSLRERAKAAGFDKLGTYLLPWILAADGLDVSPQALIERMKQEARKGWHGGGLPAAPVAERAAVSDLVTEGTPEALEQLRELGREVDDALEVLDRRLRPGRLVEIRAEVLRLVTERQRDAGALLELVKVRGASPAEVHGVIRDMHRAEELAARDIYAEPEDPTDQPRLKATIYRLPLKLVPKAPRQGKPRGDTLPSAKDRTLALPAEILPVAMRERSIVLDEGSDLVGEIEASRAPARPAKKKK